MGVISRLAIALGLSALAMTLVVTAAPEAHAQSAFKKAAKKATPALIRGAKGCKSHLTNPKMAAKCMACVTRKKGHAFFPKAKAGKRCQVAQAAAPKPPAVVKAAKVCKTRIAHRKMAAKCIACVTRKGPGTYAFYPPRKPGKRCVFTAPAPPAMVKDAGTCKGRIFDKKMKAKCLACVTRKGPGTYTFHPPQKPGQRCAFTPPPAPAMVKDARTCKGRIFDKKMKAKCLACVTRKGPGTYTFHPPQKPGQRCAFAPPPPPSVARDAGTCKSRIYDPKMKAKCLACVTRKGPGKYTFHPPHGAGKRCVFSPPPPPAMVKDAGSCKARVYDPKMKAMCMACVTRKGPGTYTFHPPQKPGQRCAFTPPPAPPVVRTAGSCKSQVYDPKMKAMCLACVTRKGPGSYSFHPPHAAGQRCVFAAPPPPSVVNDAGTCKAKVYDPKMKAKCLACVTRKGLGTYTFHPPQKPGQRCAFAPPPPPSVARDAGTCKGRIYDPKMKAKCLACVTRKGPGSYGFHTGNRAGKRCVFTAPRPPALVKDAGSCKGKIFDRKMLAKCLACVTRGRGHTFRPFAAAGKRCTAPVARVPKTPSTVHTAAQCKALGDRKSVAKCMACVSRKGSHAYRPGAPAGSRCKAQGRGGMMGKPKPTPAKRERVLHRAAGCKKLGDRKMIAKCKACVTRKKGHGFYPDRGAGKRCVRGG